MLTYKGKTLFDGEERQNEILCTVVLNNPEQDEEITFELEDRIEEAFESFKYDVYVESVEDNVLEVRCDDITLDMKGVKLLKKIHDKLLRIDMDIDVKVAVSVDDFWEDGSDSYNEDVVTWDEFIKEVQ